MPLKKKTTTKTSKKLPLVSRFSFGQLFLFALIFVVLSSYLLWQSFAASNQVVMFATSLTNPAPSDEAGPRVVVDENSNVSKRGKEVVYVAAARRATMIRDLPGGTVHKICLIGRSAAGANGAFIVSDQPQDSSANPIVTASVSIGNADNYATLGCVSVRKPIQSRYYITVTVRSGDYHLGSVVISPQ